MTVAVGRLPPGDQWDQNMLLRLLTGDLYPTGIKFDPTDGYPDAEGCVLLVPGRYWHQRIDEVNAEIDRYQWVLLMRTSDEEDLFAINDVRHPNCKIWVQTPRINRNYGSARLIPLGFPPHFNDLPAVEKAVDVFLSAQKTHARRVQCFDALARSQHTDNVHATEGFTQGMRPADYARAMTQARVAPAPAGAVSADSFRLWEALEAHTIPIADDYSPVDGRTGYWSRMHPDAPYPILTNYQDLPGYIEDCLAEYPRRANRIAAWWIREKRALAHALRDDLKELACSPS